MKIWVYLDGRQQGPFEIEQLYDLPIDRNTKVWFEGLPRWCDAGDIEDLQCLFGGAKTVSEQSEQSEHSEISEYSEYSEHSEHSEHSEPCPTTYLGLSIFLAICCCSPLSIGALISSICVSSFYRNGNIERAQKASEIAAWLIMIAIALGFLPVMLMGSFF